MSRILTRHAAKGKWHRAREHSIFFPPLPIKEPYGVLLDKPGVGALVRQEMPALGWSLCMTLISMRSGALRWHSMSTAPLPTALVINDDASQLHLMAALLEKDGLRVVPCQSAEEALDILE